MRQKPKKKKKKTKKMSSAVLFNIVPQAAIEILQSQHQLPMTDHWGPTDGPISEKEGKMVVDQKKERLIDVQLEPQVTLEIKQCTTNHFHAGFGMTDMMDWQVGRKFHLNTFYILRKIQIFSSLNVS
jgi:hypothetical protein